MAESDLLGGLYTPGDSSSCPAGANRPGLSVAQIALLLPKYPSLLSTKGVEPLSIAPIGKTTVAHLSEYWISHKWTMDNSSRQLKRSITGVPVGCGNIRNTRRAVSSISGGRTRAKAIDCTEYGVGTAKYGVLIPHGDGEAQPGEVACEFVRNG